MTMLGRGRSRTANFCLGLSGAMALVMVWSRFANLGTSFWSDEAYSAFYYSDRGPRAIFFSTYVPNNHVLYNLLTWATTGMLGRFEAAYRLWSVVPGIAAVALVAYWAWKRVGPVASTMIVVFATVSPVHLVLTPQARGYGLAMLAGAAMLITASRASDRASDRDVAYFAVSAIIGIWTLPVFALAAAAQALVLLADRTIRRASLIACGVIAAASLAFYAPMLSDIAHNTHQEFGTRLPVYGFITGPYDHLAKPTLGYGTPLPLNSTLNAIAVFLVVAVLAIAAIVRLGRRNHGDRALLAHLTIPVFVTYLAFVGARLFVQPRFASYLLFHVLVLLAIGMQRVWDVLSKATPARVIAALLVVAFALTGAQRVELVVKQQAELPWENTRFVAEVTKASGIGYVFTDSTKPGALYYYLGKPRVIVLGPGSLAQRTYCAVKGRLIFVDDRYHRAQPPDLSCLFKRGAKQIHVPQQVRPPIRFPGAVYMYIVPALR